MNWLLEINLELVFMPNIVALIPARSGSKGVVNKNIKKLGGHPLLAWAIAACQKTNIISKVIVSTDSVEYAEIAKYYGAEVPFLRPKDLSDDSSTDYEFIKHAIDWFDFNSYKIDFIVHIRPTSPYRNPLIIDKAINCFLNSSNLTSLRSVHEMSETAYKSFEIDNIGNLMQVFTKNSNLDGSNNSRHLYPKTYQANGYVDVLNVNFIKKNKLIHGNESFAFVTNHVIEVDSEYDFNLLELELLNNPSLINIFNT